MKRTMGRIEYRVTFNGLAPIYVTVEARSINAGFGKAAAYATKHYAGQEISEVRFNCVVGS